MSDAEIFGRQLLAGVIHTLHHSAMEHRERLPKIDAESFTAGILSAMVMIGVNFPFEATSLSQMQLAEDLILCFHKLTGDKDALESTEKTLNRIKEQLYGNITPHKGSTSLN